MENLAMQSPLRLYPGSSAPTFICGSVNQLTLALVPSLPDEHSSSG